MDLIIFFNDLLLIIVTVMIYFSFIFTNNYKMCDFYSLYSKRNYFVLISIVYGLTLITFILSVQVHAVEVILLIDQTTNIL